VFPGQYESVQPLLEHDAILLVKGRVDRRARGEELQLRAVEITEPDLAGAGRPRMPEGVLVIEIPAASCTPSVIGKLKELLGTHAGPTPVQVRFIAASGVHPLDVGALRVQAGEGLLSELRLLLGPQAARFVPSRQAGSVVPIPAAEVPAQAAT